MATKHSKEINRVHQNATGIRKTIRISNAIPAGELGGPTDQAQAAKREANKTAAKACKGSWQASQPKRKTLPSGAQQDFPAQDLKTNLMASQPLGSRSFEF